LLAGFSNEEIVEFLKTYKSNNQLSKAIFGSITEIALNCKASEWLDELSKEDDYFKSKKYFF
jgi:hypothetical protein